MIRKQVCLPSTWWTRQIKICSFTRKQDLVLGKNLTIRQNDNRLQILYWQMVQWIHLNYKTFHKAKLISEYLKNCKSCQSLHWCQHMDHKPNIFQRSLNLPASSVLKINKFMTFNFCCKLRKKKKKITGDFWIK
jgi:hypothetical protein